jgi:hypothetical protein
LQIAPEQIDPAGIAIPADGTRVQHSGRTVVGGSASTATPGNASSIFFNSSG